MQLHAMLLLLAILADAAVQAFRQLLEDAKVGLDRPALVTFFQRRTPTPELTKQLEQLVRQLGNDRFALREKALRELIRIGIPALKALRPALANPDREIAYRAKACIAETKKRVGEKLKGSKGMTVAEIRDLLGATRKYAVPLCEYLDRINFTRREGDLRVLNQ